MPIWCFTFLTEKARTMDKAYAIMNVSEDEKMVEGVVKMSISVPKIQYHSPEKAEVEDTVRQYRKAREKGEDGIAYITQPYWYANKLARQAMKEHGIRLKEEYRTMAKREKTYTITTGDGNFKRIQYHSPVCREKIYYKGETPVLTITDYLQERYILADTRHENSKMCYCKNCGALNDTTKDYDGCVYCGTPIRIREVHKKIVSADHELSGDWYHKRLVVIVCIIMFFLMLAAGMVQMVQDNFFEYGVHAGEIMYLLLTTIVPVLVMGPLMGIIIGNILFVPILISLQCSDGRINKIGYEMRKKDPNFSHTEFYGLLQAYTRMWFLSREITELGCISETENSGSSGIIDVECVRCKASRVWEDSDFTYIQMKLKVCCVRMQEEKPIKEKQVCTITTKRKKGVISSLQIETLKCKNCGAVIDILSGGICAYCGTTVEVSAIDWMLCDVIIE